MKTEKVKKWIYRHENCVRRTFVGYAVSQHPYHRPPGLFNACEALIEFLRSELSHDLDVFKFHPSTLGKKIKVFCHSCPIVIRWNKPRKGKHKYIFTSRYDHPKPEYDFIDLDALACNVTRDLTRDDD